MTDQASIKVKYTPNTTSDAFDLGFELFKREPELLGVEVWRRAVTELGTTLEEQFDFVTGYMTGRLQKDEYERERHAQVDPRGG